jgi:signal transduction histidine kinase
MSIRVKVLLFAAVALGLICMLGLALFLGTRQAGRIRERQTALQQQLDAYDKLEDGAWPYLNALNRARQAREDTAPVLREEEAQLERLRQLLGDTIAWEQSFSEYGPREEELLELEEALLAMRAWAAQAEAHMRTQPAGQPVDPAVEWMLFQEYERGVGWRIKRIEQEEREELEQMQRQWDGTARVSQSMALIIPAFCAFLLGVLGLAILLPLRSALRRLLDAARRIGQGQFDLELPGQGPRELVTLAQAFNRMAAELNVTLREKQRLMRAEAEASEREARRYSALLEETVRTRTAELAASNARLEDSLRELQSTQKQLLLADRLASIGQLAAGVGHEINNPLAYVVGNLRFIQEELLRLQGPGEDPERQELMDALAEAREGAERVRLIVQDLKSVAREDDMALGPVDLAAVVRTAAKIAGAELRPRARVVLACEGLPPVQGNVLRLGQVFLNLLINAAHAIAPGRPEENEVRVEARPSGPGHVTLEVRDTGSGIPPEHLTRIFEPFFTTKPVGVGSGLGLSVCRGIITSLGGHIEVESEVGRGTCFRLTLRVAEERAGGARVA